MAEETEEIIKIDEAILDKEKYSLDELIESIDGMPFTVDNRKMLEKMQKYRSTDPFSYIPEIIGIAVESKSRRIKVKSSLTQLSIEYDGKGLRREEIDNLLSKLFGASEDRELQDRYGRLALSVLGALASKPKEVIIETAAGREKTKLVIDGSNYEEKFYKGTIDKGTKITIKRCTRKEWLKKSLKKLIVGQYIKDKFFSKEKKKVFDYCKYIEPKLYFNLRKMNRPFRAPISGAYRSKFERGNLKGEIVDIPWKLSTRIGPLNCEFDSQSRDGTDIFFFRNGIYLDHGTVHAHTNSRSIVFAEDPDFETIVSGNRIRQTPAVSSAIKYIEQLIDGDSNIACFNYHWNLEKRKLNPNAYIYEVLKRVIGKHLSFYGASALKEKNIWESAVASKPELEPVFKRKIFRRTDMKRISISDIVEKKEKEKQRCTLYCSEIKGTEAEPQDIVLYAPRQTALGYFLRREMRVNDLDEILKEKRKRQSNERLEKKIKSLTEIFASSWKGTRTVSKYVLGAGIIAGAGYGGYELFSNLPLTEISWMKVILGVGGTGAGIGALGLAVTNADKIWSATKTGLHGISSGMSYAGGKIKGKAGKMLTSIGTKIGNKIEQRKNKKDQARIEANKLAPEEENFIKYLNKQARKDFSGIEGAKQFFTGKFEYGSISNPAKLGDFGELILNRKNPFIRYLIHEHAKDPERTCYLMPGFFAFASDYTTIGRNTILPAKTELAIQERAAELCHQNLYKKAYHAYLGENSFDEFVQKTTALSEEQKKKLFWKILYKTEDKKEQKDLWISENHSALLEKIASEEIEIQKSHVPESYFHEPDKFKEKIIELYEDSNLHHIREIYSSILDLNSKFNNHNLNKWYLDIAGEQLGNTFREDLEEIKHIKDGVPEFYFHDVEDFSEELDLMKPSQAKKAYKAIMDLPSKKRSWKHIQAIREKFPQATAAVDASRQKTTWYNW